MAKPIRHGITFKMISLAHKMPDPMPEIARYCERMTGASVTNIEAITGGGNNKIFRLETGTDTFALKIYPRSPDDARERLQAEFNGLSFLYAEKIREVPRAVARDDAHDAALYEWVEGEPINAVRDDDVLCASRFIRHLLGVSRVDAAAELPVASEACLSAGELVAQIERRLEKLEHTISSDTVHAFLKGKFAPCLVEMSGRAISMYQKNNVSFGVDLAQPYRTLSPSDFGFHNAIRTETNKIIFIDFEYFGWDDPVKLVSDFILHPGHTLTDHQKTRFVDDAFNTYRNDPFFLTRFDALFPLYGLRWCMILLNAFLPERMARFLAAGRHQDPEMAQVEQLRKAETMLETISTKKDGFAYGR